VKGRESKKECVHYWKIDGNDVGTCIHCGETRDFGALQGKYTPRDSPKKQPGKPHGRIGRPKKKRE